MLVKKWLNGNASCCLTKANRLSNVLLYLEIWTDVFFSVADQSGSSEMTYAYTTCNLERSTLTSSQQRAAEDNGGRVNMVYEQ